MGDKISEQSSLLKGEGASSKHRGQAPSLRVLGLCPDNSTEARGLSDLLVVYSQ